MPVLRLRRVGWRNPWLPIAALVFAWLMAWWIASFAVVGRTLSPTSAVGELSGAVLLITVAVLAGLSVWTYLAAFSLLRLSMLVRNTPTSRLSAAAQGMVELTGRASSFDAGGLRAPESGHPCVWYSSCSIGDDLGWEILGHINFAPAALGWTAMQLSLIPGETSRDSLVLSVQDGECVVDPVGAFVLPGRRRSSMSYREQVIEPGSDLFVLGELQTRRHDAGSLWQAGIDGRVGELLRAWKQDQDDLRRRFNFAGEHPTTDEWERVRSAAFEAAVAEAGARPVECDESNATHCIAQPRSGQPYLIAAMTEKTLLRRLDWSVALNLIGGLASGAALIQLAL